MTRLIRHCFLLFFLIFGFSFQIAFAEGKMIIKPMLITGWQTDSNFYKSETNEHHVHTYSVKPGLEFGRKTDKSLVSIKSSANILRYDDQNDTLPGQKKAEDFNYIEHYAFLTAETQITDRMLLGLDNLFLKTRDPANADTTANVVDRYKYTLNHFTPRIYYQVSEKFGLAFKYTNFITDYSDDGTGEGEDSNENRGTFNFFYSLSPRTSFDLDYQLWSRNYDATTSDYNSHQVLFNLNHQFNYFTLSAGAGYHNREFDQTVLSGDIDKFIWKLSLKGQNPAEPVKIPKSAMQISINNNFNDSGTGNTYFEATRINASFSHLFLEKINCALNVWFQNSDYKTSDREDNRWFVSAKADYLINDFFSLGLEGGMEDRDSNEIGRDFNNQYLMINGEFNYDMGDK
ncbi:MAG: outer membrane beta-barrel protein [Desulfobacteraceae bacterium]|nr:outer membrane beta-barrel protein [Desulfobacteraceae bacterium]